MAERIRGYNATSLELTRMALLVTAIFSALAGLTLAVATIAKAPQGAALNGGLVFIALGWLIGGTVPAALLAGLAALLNVGSVQVRQGQLAQTTFDQMRAAILQLEQTLRAAPAPTFNIAAPSTPMAAISYTPAPATVAEAAAPSEEVLAAITQALDLLEQLRDLTMMNPEQRGEYASRHWERRREFLLKMIERHTLKLEWEQAAHYIEEFRTLMPNDALAGQLAIRLSEEQARHVKQEIATARLEIRQLASVAAWDRVDAILDTLQRRYPDEPEVRALAEDTHRERHAVERERYNNLMEELKDATDRRQWRRAYELANHLVEKYPNEKRVQRLRPEVDTLRENAEVQERHEEEALFKDLLQRQRYEEAAIVARRVIDKYPVSSTAVELGKLLPKVEELIRQEKLKRQQLAAKE